MYTFMGEHNDGPRNICFYIHVWYPCMCTTTEHVHSAHFLKRILVMVDLHLLEVFGPNLLQL